jgi:hypothetical protein
LILAKVLEEAENLVDEFGYLAINLQGFELLNVLDLPRD